MWRTRNRSRPRQPGAGDVSLTGSTQRRMAAHVGAVATGAQDRGALRWPGTARLGCLPVVDGPFDVRWTLVPGRGWTEDPMPPSGRVHVRSGLTALRSCNRWHLEVDVLLGLTVDPR